MWTVLCILVGVIVGYFVAALCTMSARNELESQLDQVRLEHELLRKDLRYFIASLEGEKQ